MKPLIRRPNKYGKPVVSHEILGLDSLMEMLEDLPVRMRENMLRTAVTEGTRTLLPVARQMAPVSKKPRTGVSGAYRASLDVRRATVKRKTGDVIAGVGLNKRMLYKLGHAKRPSNLPHLLEKGHRVVVRRSTGLRILGRTRAIKHLEPALMQTARKAESTVRVTLARSLDKFLRDRMFKHKYGGKR
jgi:hypothetical protein